MFKLKMLLAKVETQSCLPVAVKILLPDRKLSVVEGLTVCSAQSQCAFICK